MKLAAYASALAAAHQPLRRRSASAVPLVVPKLIAASLARATRGFHVPRPAEPRFQKASEWFLDNHYLASRALRQIQTEFPPGFRSRLPHVGDESVPRVLRVAQALLDETRLELDEATLLSFVDAYQKQSSLTIAELWALPAMLRIVTLQALVRVLDAFFVPEGRKAPGDPSPVEPDTAVERAVRVLRCLSEMDWRYFVQRTSAVEAALREDPSGVYARMDFDSRDSYRKAVEELAWNTEKAEPEVASLAVALAAEGRAAIQPDAVDGREGHVGYYLIDLGRERLKERVHYRGRGMDRARDAVLARPTLAYLGSIATLSSMLLTMVAAAMARGFGSGLVALVCALLVVPVVSVIVGVVNWCMSRLLVARRLPKLDFSAAIPADCRTAVVVPALVARGEDLDELLAQLELHYLSCPDPSIAYILLTDHADSAHMPDDSAIIAHADKVVQRLNAKWGNAGPGPFHVLHRRAQWNSAEGCFMGWERKRGKLEELNRLLRGDVGTSYRHRFGNPAGLAGIRFVITLDADTRLPLGAARKLIGLAAHPLNSARFDLRTGSVTAGYTVAQPRVEASPVEGATTIFSRFWSGDTALDIYTRATSDVYQDLFGSGAYVGKGIYEVDAFRRSVEGRVPSNTLASHDLFEGIHGRSALVTDVVVFEQYPHSYLSFARRMHRWIRGDWQLLPWLLPRAPSQSGPRLTNRLSLIDRWKIVDNLRRSLLAPSLVALFFLGWLELSRRAGPLFLAPLALPLVISAPAFLDGQRRQTLGRWALGLVFLPHEAFVACDAIVRAVIRMAITRRHLLQWVTAADTARAFAAGSRGQFWREMGPAAALVAAAGTALAFARPAGLPYAAPVLILWMLSPEVARWVSVGAGGVAREALSPHARRTLRQLARRTWLFFETFVGPGDQWLAPDNFQEEPGGVIAHRTSPTNIGLMLIAELSAYDLGYIGRAELSALVGQALATLDRLERYRGHWLNWYNTRTLEPLLPRYVSTVDSGNLAAALITMAKGCRDAAYAPMVRSKRFEGLGDTVDLLEESLAHLSSHHPGTAAPIDAIRRTLMRAQRDPTQSGEAAKTLTTTEIPALGGALLDVLSKCTTNADIAAFRETNTWLDRLHHQTRSLHRDLGESDGADVPRHDLLELADRCDAAHASVDFAFLFDGRRKLFHIGYNATSDRLDSNYYDLLASEARLASSLAVAASQVPPEHWFMLGRPINRIRGRAALLSWGGTMFEYLMPTLFMRSQERTLLQQSAELAVAAQVTHGTKAGLPWGVSESGYAQLDAQRTYQYRSFGVPGLGLRRGLEEDRVVAPYACVLALPFRPQAVMENVEALGRAGALGLYGLFEAIDYDELRALESSRTTGEATRNHAIVRSYMAHHQGMILAALNNALSDGILVERFHANTEVKTAEPLLSERLPSVKVAENLAPPGRT